MPRSRAARARPDDAADVSRRVCERVGDLRRQRGWTLEQLAAASGVSRSMLSEIERQRANPTLGVAVRIAAAFGLALAELVDAGASPSRIDVIRGDDRRALYRDDPQVRIRTLSPLHLEKDVEFYELTLAAAAALRSAAHFQGTREVLTVQRGHVRVECGQDVNDLAPGDSAHYPADVPHAIVNTGKVDAVVFLVDLYRGS